MRIAVLGMGRMGQGLTLRLLADQHDVTVWNRTPDKTAPMVERGATAAGRISEATDGADVVITSLTDDNAVREVALGPDGLLEHIGSALYVDMSTVSPSLSDHLAARFPRFAAMPVAGNPEVVQQGEAVLLVGGPPDTIEYLRPVIAALSSVHREYGQARLAGVAKLSTNLSLLVGVTALAESIAVGREGGLSDAELRELLAESSVVAPGVRQRFGAVLSGEGPTLWTTALGAKDVGLALALATEDLPVAAAVRERFETAVDQGLGDLDVAAVTKLY